MIPKANIIGRAKAKHIPEGAEYALLSHDQNFVQIFIRFFAEAYNDGTTIKRLQFWGANQSWEYAIAEQEWYTSDKRYIQIIN